MFKDFIKESAGMDIYPLLSLSIFFIFFILVIVWAIIVKKEYLQEMKNMPLQNNDEVDENNSEQVVNEDL